MKERIISLFLALTLVISIFAVREKVLSFANASGVTSNSEGDENKYSIQSVNEIRESEIVDLENNLLEGTIPETTEVTEPEIINEYYDEYFGEDITFSSEYVSRDDVMSYALYTPSTIDETKKTPLIVWLHGSGEVRVDSTTFFSRGLPNVMNDWTLNGFNAYVICPHLSGNWNTGRWNLESTKTNLQNLLDKFIAEHNIDLEHVIIVGHSLGGQGALYMAHELPEYFTKCVVLSGYNSGIDISEISIPTIGYVGTTRAGEDGSSVSYMQNHVAKTFGEENVFFIECSHGQVPNKSFNFDDDANSNSDLVEWMLS